MRIQVTQKICHYMVLTVFLTLAILVDISKELKKIYVTFSHEILIIFTFWVLNFSLQIISFHYEESF